MNDRYWLLAATIGYLVSAAWGIFALGASRSPSGPWNTAVLVVSFILQSVFLQQRGAEMHHCPITNLFETMAFFSWSLMLTYLVIGSAYRMSILGVFTAPMVFLINFFALVTPIDLPHNPPDFGWQLELHASLTLMGFGTLGMAALASVMYLIQERQIKRRALTNWFYNLPAMGRLEIVQRRVLAWGFLLFSAGLLIGFFIPRQEYVDWVKVAWTGLVWFLYFGLLVLPRLAHLSQKKVAVASVCGYIFVLLTFWGINSLTNAHRFGS